MSTEPASDLYAPKASASDNMPEINAAEPAKGDWLKLYRCILESRVFAHSGLLKLWIWCLCRATYKKRPFSIRTGTGETVVDLLPGQFLFGRDSAAKELQMPASTVRDRMKKLKNMQYLVMKPAGHYSLVTICNWDTYQSNGGEERQATRQPAANQPPASRHKQEGKEDKELFSVPGKSAKKELMKKRETDPLFDALVKATGVDPNTAGSHVGKVCKALRRAEPPFEAADVLEFAERLPELLPWSRGTPTLGLIEKYIGKIRNNGIKANGPKESPSASVQEFEKSDQKEFVTSIK